MFLKLFHYTLSDCIFFGENEKKIFFILYNIFKRQKNELLHLLKK